MFSSATACTSYRFAPFYHICAPGATAHAPLPNAPERDILSGRQPPRQAVGQLALSEVTLL